LKPGGKLRISTPDLSFLIELYNNKKSVSTSQYLQWAKEMFLETAPCFEEIFVINNFVRAWGHKFIYDGRLLRYSLEQAGFEEIVACGLNESMDEELRNLEHTARMPAEFLRMESIIFEGMKPHTREA
jgi:predicted SAM-dependent methyltransferase